MPLAAICRPNLCAWGSSLCGLFLNSGIEHYQMVSKFMARLWWQSVLAFLGKSYPRLLHPCRFSEKDTAKVRIDLGFWEVCLAKLWGCFWRLREELFGQSEQIDLGLWERVDLEWRLRTSSRMDWRGGLLRRSFSTQSECIDSSLFRVATFWYLWRMRWVFSFRLCRRSATQERSLGHLQICSPRPNFTDFSCGLFCFAWFSEVLKTPSPHLGQLYRLVRPGSSCPECSQDRGLTQHMRSKGCRWDFCRFGWAAQTDDCRKCWRCEVHLSWSSEWLCTCLFHRRSSCREVIWLLDHWLFWILPCAVDASLLSQLISATSSDNSHFDAPSEKLDLFQDSSNMLLIWLNILPTNLQVWFHPQIL